MCVLTGKEIFRRRHDIFRGDTWAKDSFQEATYDLRIDTGPVLRVGGKVYEKCGLKYEESNLTIQPGEMALLPTIESFDMPSDLVGDIKIKFSHSQQGLSPLFGPKVDPYFGHGHCDERLYLWVSNLGVNPITLRRGERVFTVQFHKLWGDAPEFVKKPKLAPQMAKEAYRLGSRAHLGFVDKIESSVENNLGDRLAQVEQGTKSVIMFGLFLIASALLAGALTTLFMMMSEDTNAGMNVVDTLNALGWPGKLVGISLAVAFAALGIALALTLTFTSVTLFRRPERTQKQ